MDKCKHPDIRPFVLAAFGAHYFVFDWKRKPAVRAFDASRIQTVPFNGLFHCSALWDANQGISLAQK